METFHTHKKVKGTLPWKMCIIYFFLWGACGFLFGVVLERIYYVGCLAWIMIFPFGVLGLFFSFLMSVLLDVRGTLEEIGNLSKNSNSSGSKPLEESL